MQNERRGASRTSPFLGEQSSTLQGQDSGKPAAARGETCTGSYTAAQSPTWKPSPSLCTKKAQWFIDSQEEGKLGQGPNCLGRRMKAAGGGETSF